MNDYYFGITEVSANKKTGPITTIKSDKSTCPSTCKLKKKGCYAKSYPLVIFWNRLYKNGLSYLQLINKIRKLPKNQITRFWEAGDFPGKYNKINKLISLAIAKASKRIKGFCYTHYHPTKHNLPILKEINNYITVNLSADSIKEADYYMTLGLQVVTLIPQEHPKLSYSPAGNKIVICPYQTRKTKNCHSCGNYNPLCLRKERDYIIGFYPHANAAKSINIRIMDDFNKY